MCCSILQCVVAVCDSVLQLLFLHTAFTAPGVLQCVALDYCSALQCVAALVPSRCLHSSRCVAVCCSVLQCVAVCCSVLQCVVAACDSVLQLLFLHTASAAPGVLQCVAVNYCSVLQYVALCCSSCFFTQPPQLQVCCSMLQCVIAVCCSMLQYAAVCCNVLQLLSLFILLAPLKVCCMQCIAVFGNAVQYVAALVS